MKRLVYTIAIGKPRFGEMAMGLGRSLAFIGDDTPRAIITDLKGYDWGRYFTHVLEPKDPIEWIFFSKLTALDRTDADQILFIDSDSLAFKRLGPIFEHCQGNGFAVQGKLESKGDWYGDLADHCKRLGVRALPKFNGGLIYYERGQESEQFIQSVYDYGRRAKELGFQRDDPLIPDEPCIALAMAEKNYGLLVPETMDFMSTGPGLIGKLHMDILEKKCHFVVRRSGVYFVEPTIFHAAAYCNFRIYWKQLATLESLEEYADAKPPGYRSPWFKLRRSIERRYLQYIERRF